MPAARTAAARYQRYRETDREQLQRFVETYSHSAFLSREPEQHYAIQLNANGAMIGDLSLFFTEADNCFTLGVTIASAFQRQGYAAELVQAVVAQLRAYAPGVDLVALIDRDNAASLALFKKLGFAEESYAPSIHSCVYAICGRGEERLAQSAQ